MAVQGQISEDCLVVHSPGPEINQVPVKAWVADYLFVGRTENLAASEERFEIRLAFDWD